MSTEPAEFKWRPQLLLSLQNYTRQDLAKDLLAGLTVGLVALPLAMAFGIASGVTPQAGLYTAVVAGFLISALGGSRHQIGGPTGAFVVIILGIIAKYGVSGLLTVTFMAGAILVLMGLTGLGTAVKYIPRPVTIGFTHGIAVLIASTQLKDFLGLPLKQQPGEFLPRMQALLGQIGHLSWPTVALGLGSLAVILLMPRLTPRIPGPIVALGLGTLATALLSLPVATLGSRFGGIPTGFPPLALPPLRADLLGPLLPSALTVALLAAVESLLSAVVADSMTGRRHNSNVELIAQGIANLAVPLFGGIPATGAIARTATNIRSGARSPVAGIVHALTLLTILLIAAPLAYHIPLATLAAVLLVVAWNMGEWREIRVILRLSKADKLVWLTTFGLTVLADLTVAVEVGIVLAALLYIYRVAQTTTIVAVDQDYLSEGLAHNLLDKPLPAYVTVLRIQGPLLFGAADKLAGLASPNLGTVVILRLREMTALDATGLHAIESFAAELQRSGRHLLLCGALEQPEAILKRSTLLEQLGRENLLPSIGAALARAEQLAAAGQATSPVAQA